MRVELAVLCLVTALIHPEAALGQGSPSPVRLQISGLFSEFRYERGSEVQWRAASTLRLRFLLPARFFGEVSYTAPFISEGPAYCPGLPECPPELADMDDKTAWWFSALSGSFAFRLPAGMWTPSLGVGGGRRKTEDESLWSWLGFIGVERALSKRTGMLLEYRVHRVDWPSEGLSWHHEVGVGLTFTFF